MKTVAVSVVRLDEPLGALKRAMELCGGLEGLGPGSRVFIKPNICLSRWMPLYGMVTTTSILEGLVRLLAERGCRDITIGEGPVDVLGSNIWQGYRRMGIDTVARRYGIKLADLNRGPFRPVDLEGVKVQVAEAAFESDFLINVPALKTHNQVRVSLGFKNLKGFLAPASRVKFHGTNRLDHLVRLLAETVKPDLTVIDGTYALESGPDTALGLAHRLNVVVAGREPHSCDIVGAALLGIEASEVGYLREYAQAHALPLRAEQIEVRGESDWTALARPLDWRVHVPEELAAVGVTGLAVPHPGETICSRCYAVLGYSLLALASDNRGRDFGNAMVCCGREVRPPGSEAASGSSAGSGPKPSGSSAGSGPKPSGSSASSGPKPSGSSASSGPKPSGSSAIILFGDCAIAANRGLAGACRVGGCPPPITRSMMSLWRVLLGRPRMLRIMPARMARMAAAGVGVFTDRPDKWRRYESGEFDPGHFRAL